MSKALKALDKMKDLIDDEWGLVDSELHDELYSTVKDALAELEDAKHNYKALEEMHNNSVAYATKIQNRLNHLETFQKPQRLELEGNTAFCPRCEQHILAKTKAKFCYHCGQRLT